jgi:mannosyltransferase OCH1-like enzyme
LAANARHGQLSLKTQANTSQLWTDESSAKFIEEHYPWFLPTFVSYPFPIQRADAIRYFILHHYGGIYLDLDDGCARSLDVMRRYPAWLRRTLPTGISNDAMGAVKGHAFFAFVTTKLESFNRSYGMPYITVMSSTGPLFLSILWKQWKRELAAAAARAATGSDAGGLGHTLADKVAVLMPPEYKGNEWSIFRIAEGSSWHGGDAKAIFWMGKHWLLLVVAGFAVAGVVFAAMWWCWSSCGKVGTVKVGGGGVPGWGRVKALGAWVKRRVVGRRRGYIKIERSDEESRCE